MTVTRILAALVACIAAFAGGVWLAVLTPDGLRWGSESVAAPVATPSAPAPSPSPILPTVVPTPYSGEALVYGDFIVVSARKCLGKLDFLVDGEVDRRIQDAVADLKGQGDSIPKGIVIALGGNGGATDTDLDAVMDVLGPERVVVWSTIQVPDDPSRYTFEGSTNEAIARLTERYPNVRVMSWNAFSMTNPDLLNKDGTMTKQGCQAFAEYADQVLRLTDRDSGT